MALNVSASPVVTVREKDLTSVISGVSTSIGGTTGQFAWGPIEEIITVDSENNLKELFGGPDSTTYIDWFSAANFLAYATDLKLVRVASSDALNALVETDTSGPVTGVTGLLVKNSDDHDNKTSTYTTNGILFAAKYAGVLGNSLKISWANTAIFDAVDTAGDATWTYAAEFNASPESGNYNVIILDEDGDITGTAGTVLEKFENVSGTAGTKKFDGSSNYLPDVLKNESSYVLVGDFSLITTGSNGISFGAGADGTAITDSERQTGFALFANTEEVDVSLLFASGASAVTAKWMIDNVADVRKDLMVFVSPESSDCVGITSASTIQTNIIAMRDTLTSSSYAFMDSAWKYQYDRYNDTYRWVPLNADIAGLCARTDYTDDPWFSPAGPIRGIIKNAIKLTHQQSKAMRDAFYKKGINPCISLAGTGIVLYGDKTLLNRASAFDRINVRRLFITIEKAIARVSRDFLFQLNDSFIRTQFVNTIEPFLRNIQGRRGIDDFKVVADESNNTAEIIDSNQLVGDIFIKPARSINFITLNFIATRSGINFDEIGG